MTSKNSLTVALLRPGAAQTSRRVSWSTTDHEVLVALLEEISSIPIRRRPARRSCWASMSAQTRVMIAPTVRHAIRINSVAVVFEACVASQATWSSKARV